MEAAEYLQKPVLKSDIRRTPPPLFWKPHGGVRIFHVVRRNISQKVFVLPTKKKHMVKRGGMKNRGKPSNIIQHLGNQHKSTWFHRFSGTPFGKPATHARKFDPPARPAGYCHLHVDLVRTIEFCGPRWPRENDHILHTSRSIWKFP